MEPNAANKKKNIFDLSFNTIVHRVEISVNKDFEIDLTDGGFADLIGYG